MSPLVAHLVEGGRGVECRGGMPRVDGEHAALVGEEAVRLGVASGEAAIPAARRGDVDDEHLRIVVGRQASGEERHEHCDLGVGEPDVVDARADRRRSAERQARTGGACAATAARSVMRASTVSTSSSDTRSAAVDKTWSNVASRSASCAASTDALRRRPRCEGALPSQLTS